MAAAAALLCVAVVSGCGSGADVGTGVGMGVGAADSPQSAARTEAADLLAAFRAPPGALHLPARPAEAPAGVAGPLTRPGPEDLVDSTDWWTAPGTPDNAVAWLKAHAPSGSLPDTSGASNDAVYVGFNRPATPVLITRTLGVTAAPFHGGTLLRVDAEVVWLPERPAGARVPSSATRLVVRAHTGLGGPGAGNPVVVLATVTDAARVRKAADLVNGLPPAEPGMRSCPADNGRSLRLEFYATGSSPVAVVDAALTGCQGADLTVRGGPQHTELEGGATGFGERLLALLGLRFSAR